MPGQEPTSRRTLIARGAAVTAAAWVAPQIVSAPAASAVTPPPPACTTETVDWINDVAGGGPFPFAVANPTSVVKGATTFTFSYVDSTSAVTTSAVDSTFLRSSTIPPAVGTDPTYHMQLGASGAGPVTITLGFSSPVQTVRFSVLDVDISAGTWRDEIEVQGRLGAGLYFDGVAAPGANTGTVVANRTFRGNTNTGNSAILADVFFTFAGPLDEVRIIYRRAGTIASQGIGLSNVELCA